MAIAQHTEPTRCWYMPPDETAARRARGLVDVECRERGLPRDLIEAAVLAVDELATNAVRYGPFEVRLYEHPLAWGVADREPAGVGEIRARLAGRISVPKLADRGRGLLIVAALFPDHCVHRTTIEPGIPGKEVRIVLPA